MSSNERKKIPDAPVPTAAAGNLLSSVAPPSQLPNFVTSVPAPVPVGAVVPPLPPQLAATLPPQTASAAPTQMPAAPTPLPVAASVPNASAPVPAVLEATTPEKFSPAIPPSKGEPMLSIRSPEDTQTTQSPESLPDSLSDDDRIGDVMPGSGLFTWVKGAVATGGILQRVAERAKSSVDSMITTLDPQMKEYLSYNRTREVQDGLAILSDVGEGVATGGILQRVAERAKSSVDSMITTLDPQMKEYLNSGGDITIVVASDKEVKISPVREAFQAVFGKATVIGYAAQSDVTATQPVGYAAALAAAKQRIAHIRSAHSEIHNNVPIVAVEGFLHEPVADRWYMLDLLVLSQPSLGIELHAQSQGAAVPAAAVAAARAATPGDYQHAQTGLGASVPALMAASLQVPHNQWHEASTGVSRRELILLAAKSLAGSYKRLLAVSAAEL